MLKTAELFQKKLSQNEIRGGGFIFFKGQETIAAETFGLARGENSFSLSSKLRVASISKLVTAIAAMLLVRDGKLNLDIDCSEQLGFLLRHPDYPQSPITPRMILSHTSGIRDGGNYIGVIGEKLSDFFDVHGAQYENGGHWAKSQTPLGGFCYSNLGMGVIAQAIENITQLRFDIFVRDAIFRAVGIDCGFNWSGVPLHALPNTSPLYRRKNDNLNWVVQVDGDLQSMNLPLVFAKDGLTLNDYKIGTNGLLFSPQGGLRASLMDLQKIAQILMGFHNILDQDLIADMQREVWNHKLIPLQHGGENGSFMAFGTGIHHILPDESSPIKGLNTKLLGHYGQAYGLLALLCFDPKSQKGFIYLLNGTLEEPKIGTTGLFEIEEEFLNAAAFDNGFVG